MGQGKRVLPAQTQLLPWYAELTVMHVIDHAPWCHAIDVSPVCLIPADKSKATHGELWYAGRQCIAS